MKLTIIVSLAVPLAVLLTILLGLKPAPGQSSDDVSRYIWNLDLFILRIIAISVPTCVVLWTVAAFSFFSEVEE